MTPQQRMLAAIRGEPLDRLAAATYNCHGFAWGQHAACAEYGPILAAVRRTGAGMLCKVSAGRSGGLPAPKSTRTVQGGEAVTTEVLQTPAGPLRRVVRQPPGQPSRCVEPYVKSDADIERLLSLKPRPVRWRLDGLLAKCSDIGTDGVPYLGYADPFASVITLFDQEDLLVRVHTELDAIVALIDSAFARTEEELTSLLDALAPAGAEVLFYTGGPEYATPPLMPPEVFARVVTPYHSRLTALIRRRGFPVSLHCHGRIRQVLGEILKCGFDVLEPIEPPPQGDIDLAGLRAAAGETMSLMGYVQDQDLYTATPEQIREHVASIVATVGAGSRHVATPTCTPFQFPPTPAYVANYVAFLEAAAELGA